MSAVYRVTDSASALYHWARLTSDRRFLTACSARLTLQADPSTGKPAEEVKPGERCRAPGCAGGWSDWRPFTDPSGESGQTGILSVSDSV